MNKKGVIQISSFAVLFLIVISSLSMTFKIASAFYVTGYEWSISVNPINYYDNDSYSETSSSASSWYISGLLSFSSSTSSSPIHAHTTYDDETDADGWTYLTVYGSTITNAQCYTNSYYCDDYPSAARKSVIVHEFGHSVGLNENSDIELYHAIMNPFTYGDYSRYGWYGLSTPQTDDQNGIDWIY